MAACPDVLGCSRKRVMAHLTELTQAPIRIAHFTVKHRTSHTVSYYFRWQGPEELSVIVYENAKGIA